MESFLLGYDHLQCQVMVWLMQVRLRLPADIEGSVSLRSEEDGFWSRCTLRALECDVVLYCPRI